jgi:hypothetical protein
VRLELRPIRISIVIAALVLSAGQIRTQASGPGNTETHMKDTSTIIDYLGSWDEENGQPRAVLRLRGGITLLASRDSSYYDVWRRTVAFQQSKNWPLYIAYDRTSRQIEAIYSSHPRKVTSVQRQSDGKAIVVFLPSPSFYFVSLQRAGAEDMIHVLQEAVRQKKELLVVNDPSTLEILDVRFPSQ